MRNKIPFDGKGQRMRKGESEGGPKKDNLSKLHQSGLGKGLPLSHTDKLKNQYRNQRSDRVD